MRAARTDRPRPSDGRRLGAATGVAAGLHLALLGLLATLLLRPPPVQPLEEDFEPAMVAEIVLPQDLPPLDPTEVLRTNGPVEPPPPDRARYLAEQDSNPERETTTRRLPTDSQTGPAAPSTGGMETAVGEPRQGDDLGPSTLARQSAPTEAQPALRAEGQVLPEPPESIEIETVPTRPALKGASAPAAPNEVIAEATPISPGGPSDRPGLPGPVLSLPPGGDSEDLVPELPPAETTAVAARSSAMAALLNSVRERVRSNWRARDIYRKADPTGRFGGSSLTTTVNVRLASDGRVEHAEVVQGSGLPAMDQEAVAAFARAEPFMAPPGSVLDEQGGVEFAMSMEFEVLVHRFRVRTRETLSELWRPSPAFQRGGDHERITTARVLLTNEGVLAHASVVGTAGIDFLDRGVLETLRQGLRLPRPPASYGTVSGLIPLWIEFHHNVRAASIIRVLAPRERPRLVSTGR